MRKLILALRKRIYSDKIIQVIIAYPDKRLRVHWVLPENNKVTIGDMSFTINPDDVTRSNGFPTYIYNTESCEPINLYEQKSMYTADEFNIAISANVTRDIMNATSPKKDNSTLTIVLSAMSLLMSVIVIYFVATNFTEISKQLNDLKDILRLIGGIYE